MGKSEFITLEPLTEADLKEVVELYMKAFAGYMSARIGRSYVRALFQWFVNSDVSINLIAKDNSGKIVGFVIGAPLGYNRFQSRDLFWNAMQGILIRPWLFFDAQLIVNIGRRLRLLLKKDPSRKVPELPNPVMSLVGIGVLPEARGKQVGSCLIKAFEKQARYIGMKALRLSVYPSNVAARAFYEKHEWLSFEEPKQASEQEAMYYYKLLKPPNLTRGV